MPRGKYRAFLLWVVAAAFGSAHLSGEHTSHTHGPASSGNLRASIRTTQPERQAARDWPIAAGRSPVHTCLPQAPWTDHAELSCLRAVVIHPPTASCPTWLPRLPSHRPPGLRAEPPELPKQPPHHHQRPLGTTLRAWLELSTCSCFHVCMSAGAAAREPRHLRQSSLGGSAGPWGQRSQASGPWSVHAHMCTCTRRTRLCTPLPGNGYCRGEAGTPRSPQPCSSFQKAASVRVLHGGSLSLSLSLSLRPAHREGSGGSR